MAREKLDKIDVKRGWHIESMDNSLMSILMELGGATPVKHIDLRNVEKIKSSYSGNYFSYYGGNELGHIDEAVLLTDGRIYMIANISGFIDTFAEHSDESIVHYILTPKGK